MNTTDETVEIRAPQEYASGQKHYITNVSIKNQTRAIVMYCEIDDAGSVCELIPRVIPAGANYAVVYEGRTPFNFPWKIVAHFLGGTAGDILELKIVVD